MRFKRWITKMILYSSTIPFILSTLHQCLCKPYAFCLLFIFWHIRGVYVRTEDTCIDFVNHIVHSQFHVSHCSDVIMSAMRLKSQASRLFTQPTVRSGADQRKQQSSTSLAFVMRTNPYKGPVTRKMCPFDDVIMFRNIVSCVIVNCVIVKCIILHFAIVPVILDTVFCIQMTVNLASNRYLDCFPACMLPSSDYTS